jgi:predicted phosphodiesterase
MANVVHKWSKFVIGTDNHGNQQDNEAVEAFFDFIEGYKPKEVCHLGDAFEMAALRKGASDEERRESLKEDWDMGSEFLDRLRPSKFVGGNHDFARLQDWAHGRGPASDLASLWLKELEKKLDSMGTEWCPYGKRHFLRLGQTGVCLTHGVAVGRQAAEKHAQIFSCLGPVFFGHVHSHQFAQLPSIERRFGVACGALCKIDRPYNNTHAATLAHEVGWVYGEYCDKLSEVIWQPVRKIGSGFPVIGL